MRVTGPKITSELRVLCTLGPQGNVEFSLVQEWGDLCMATSEFEQKNKSYIYSSILPFRWVKSNDSQRLCRCWWFTEERKQAHRWPPTVDRRGPTPWGSLFCEEVYEYLCSKVANYSCSYIKRWICDPQQHRIYMMEGLTLLVSCVFIGSPLLVKLKIECGHFYTCGRAPLNIFIP